MAKLKQRIAWSLGFDLTRIRKSNNDAAINHQLLCAVDPTVVLDVGANVGQFAEGVLAQDPTRRVVSFEPVAASHRDLAANAARSQSRYPNWRVAPAMAIGRAAGSATINVANFSVCSSLRPMSELHTAFSSDIEYVDSETVQVNRLDEAALEFLTEDDRIYLKVDTQGFERDVLAGATGLMDRVVAMVLEGSFSEMYVGETPALDLLSDALALGFKVFGFSNGLRDPRTHALLWGDIYFVRPPPLADD